MSIHISLSHGIKTNILNQITIYVHLLLFSLLTNTLIPQHDMSLSSEMQDATWVSRRIGQARRRTWPPPTVRGPIDGVAT
jgi:hypothetical protein